MKKILSLALTLFMALSSFSALAGDKMIKADSAINLQGAVLSGGKVTINRIDHYAAYKDVDLTGVKSIGIKADFWMESAAANGDAIQLRLDDPMKGRCIGYIVLSDKEAYDKAFDGNEKTYWHSEYSKDGASTKHDPPHVITVEFPEAKAVSGITYVPRQISGNDNSEAGIWQLVDVYTSEDGEKFIYNTKLVYETTKVAQGRESATAALVKGGTFKAIRFKVSGVNGHGSAAEISFVESGAKNTDNVGSLEGDGSVDTFVHGEKTDVAEEKTEEAKETDNFITPSAS